MYDDDTRKSVLLARWCAYAASIIWSALVLAQSDVTRTAQYASLMLGHEDAWGASVGGVAWYMAWRVWTMREAAPVGLVGHVALTTFWMYVMLSLYFSPPYVYPTAGATVPVVVALHLYGLVGSRRWWRAAAP